MQNDREWKRLATEALGRPELADNPHCATGAARTARRQEVTALCTGVISRFTLDEAIAVLVAAGVACGRVNRADEPVNHPQLQARDRFRHVESPVRPIRSLPAPAIPARGDHTRRLLTEPGRTEDDIVALIGAGIVGVPSAGDPNLTADPNRGA